MMLYINTVYLNCTLMTSNSIIAVLVNQSFVCKICYSFIILSKRFNCLHPYEDFPILLSNSGTLTRIRLIATNISILLLGRTISRLPMNCGRRG